MQDASFVLFVLVPVLFAAFIALSVLSTAVGQTLSGVLTQRDQARMKRLFRETAVEGSLSAAYHVVAGISALGKRGGCSGEMVCSVCDAQQSVTISDADLCLRLYQTYLNHMEGSTYVTCYFLSVKDGVM